MAAVKVYLREPGIVSSAKRRRERGSVWRSRGLECMGLRNLDCRKEDKLAIVAHDGGRRRRGKAGDPSTGNSIKDKSVAGD